VLAIIVQVIAYPRPGKTTGKRDSTSLLETGLHILQGGKAIKKGWGSTQTGRIKGVRTHQKSDIREAGRKRNRDRVERVIPYARIQARARYGNRRRGPLEEHIPPTVGGRSAGISKVKARSKKGGILGRKGGLRKSPKVPSFSIRLKTGVNTAPNALPSKKYQITHLIKTIPRRRRGKGAEGNRPSPPGRGVSNHPSSRVFTSRGERGSRLPLRRWEAAPSRRKAN